jgi:hypothetical protein
MCERHCGPGLDLYLAAQAAAPVRLTRPQQRRLRLRQHRLSGGHGEGLAEATLLVPAVAVAVVPAPAARVELQMLLATQVAVRTTRAGPRCLLSHHRPQQQRLLARLQLAAMPAPALVATPPNTNTGSFRLRRRLRRRRRRPARGLTWSLTRAPWQSCRWPSNDQTGDEHKHNLRR